MPMNLMELRKKPHLSASGINDYLDCGLLYKFGRIDRLKPDSRPDAMEFGSTIHKVIAERHQRRMQGNSILLTDIQKRFEMHWMKAAKSKKNIKYKEGKDFETLLAEGKVLLDVYYRNIPDDPFSILAIEEAFAFTINGLSVPIIGAIDLIEEDPSGTIIVSDFKTAGKAYSTDEVDKNLQLTLYHMATKANGFKDREILLRFDCLIKTKNPQFKQFYTIRSEADTTRVVKKILKVWEGITKGVFIPNDTSWKCKGCAYKKQCDAWFEKQDN
jgi:putative RecB family exonuclease